jgi:ribosomal protein S18 acetylase RimI-like enzyme
VALLVRRLKVSDLPRLEDIEYAQLDLFPDRPGWVAHFRGMVERILGEEPEGVLIAERDGQVVGWVAARSGGQHPTRRVPFGEVMHLSVLPAEQRTGVGRRLLRESEAYLRSRGCERIRLWVPKESEKALKLFEKQGYEVTGFELERPLRPSR